MGKENPKGLILSGGKGERLRPFTYTGAKQLVPIANKPVLFYAIEDLVGCGITDIGIVAGDTRAQVEKAVGDGNRFGAKVTYIQQEAPLGIAHAVKIAADFLAVKDPHVEPLALKRAKALIARGVADKAHLGRHHLVLELGEPGGAVRLDSHVLVVSPVEDPQRDVGAVVP